MLISQLALYRNYNTKEDILRAQIDRLFHGWAEGAPKGLSLSEMIESLFCHFTENQAFYGLLNRRGLIYLLKDSLMTLYGPKLEHSKVEAYTSAFVAYTLYGWIEVWFARGMQETPQEMAEMFKSQGL
ncbi:MAG: TetR-like C-terminal domain-containing protein [Eubacteriales bacterium]|nr:TetR-like C-terminal domain-containing protein [Eubacteriales bacterium]